jgi:hypothetical protein
MAILFSVSKDEFIGLSLAAERGDQEALESLRHLWGTEREGDSIACFLCSAPIWERPIIGIIFPSLDPDVLVGAALCGSCVALPDAEKFHRACEALRMSEQTIH